MSNIDFFQSIKKNSEKFWDTIELKENVYGFQIQKGTKWNKGLDNRQIEEFEYALGFSFPSIYKDYLSVMNGTDKETINIYGNSGNPFNYSYGYYSFPRDIEMMKDRIKWILKSFELSNEEIENKQIPNIIPIVSHRFLIADKCSTNPVLSMHGSDVILYSNSLPNFLEDDIFNKKTDLSEIEVPYWL